MQKMPFFLGLNSDFHNKFHSSGEKSRFNIPPLSRVLPNSGTGRVDGTDLYRTGENALLASEDTLEGYGSSEGNGSEAGGGG